MHHAAAQLSGKVPATQNKSSKHEDPSKGAHSNSTETSTNYGPVLKDHNKSKWTKQSIVISRNVVLAKTAREKRLHPTCLRISKYRRVLMFLKNHDSKAPSGAKCKMERSNHKVTKPKKHHQKDGHVGVRKDLPKVAIKARCTPSRHIVTIHPWHVHPGQYLGAAEPAGSQNLVLSGEDGQVPHNPCQLSFNPCHQKSAKRSEAHHRIGLHQQNP